MQAIACVDQNWGIGKNKDLAIRLKSDMKRFRELTMGKCVVMGRKTFESIPGHPLPERLNVVLSADPNYGVGFPMTNFSRGKTVFLNGAEFCKYFRPAENFDLWLIGGGKIYKEFIQSCTNAEVTRVLSDLKCDTFFPDLSKEFGWKLVERSDVMKENNVEFVYEKWTNLELLEWINC